MNCPNCTDKTLESITTPLGTVHLCRSCPGIFVPWAMLASFSPDKAAFQKAIDEAQSFRLPTSRVCPQCSAFLEQGRVQEAFVILNLCMKCQSLWTDLETLEGLDLLLANGFQAHLKDPFAPVNPPTLSTTPQTTGAGLPPADLLAPGGLPAAPDPEFGARLTNLQQQYEALEQRLQDEWGKREAELAKRYAADIQKTQEEFRAALQEQLQAAEQESEKRLKTLHDRIEELEKIKKTVSSSQTSSTSSHAESDTRMKMLQNHITELEKRRLKQEAEIIRLHERMEALGQTSSLPPVSPPPAEPVVKVPQPQPRRSLPPHAMEVPPAEVWWPSEVPRPIEVPKRSEETRAAEPPKPIEPPKPAEAKIPVETPKPATKTPVDLPKPIVPTADAPKPAEVSKPKEMVKPAQEPAAAKSPKKSFWAPIWEMFKAGWAPAASKPSTPGKPAQGPAPVPTPAPVSASAPVSPAAPPPFVQPPVSKPASTSMPAAAPQQAATPVKPPVQKPPVATPPPVVIPTVPPPSVQPPVVRPVPAPAAAAGSVQKTSWSTRAFLWSPRVVPPIIFLIVKAASFDGSVGYALAWAVIVGCVVYGVRLKWLTPSKTFSETTVAGVLGLSREQLQRGVPVLLKGRLAEGSSKTLHFEDASGVMPINQWGKLDWLSRIFGLSNAGQFPPGEFTLKGWARRPDRPFIDTVDVRNEKMTRTSLVQPLRWMGLVFVLLFALAFLFSGEQDPIY
jgi:hypothetical protein